MNYKFFRYSIISILAFFMVSCIPEPIEIDNIPDADSKIVVSTAFYPGVGLAMVLSRNINVLEGIVNTDGEWADGLLIENANTTISYGNNEVVLDMISPGLYYTEELEVFSNEVYRLNVYDSLTASTVTSSTLLKEAVSFDSVRVSLEGAIEDTIPRIFYEFTDLPGSNWYMINVQHYDTITDVFGFVNRRVYNYLLTDEQVDENNKIKGDFNAFVSFSVAENEIIIVSLSNISFEYYDYLERRNNSFMALDLISEPYNLPSNIENGYGFFNLHIPDVRVIVVD